MKAIQMTEQGAPDVLRLVDLPDPVPGPGQVLVPHRRRTGDDEKLVLKP